MRFAEIIGHEKIKDRLIRSVKENRLSHAQLFTGKTGVGKLAMALAYAQFISCTNKQENDSCGECASCRKYEKLAHPDLHLVFPVISGSGADKAISDNFIQNFREQVLANHYLSYDSWLKSIEAENKQGIINKYESESIVKKLSFKTYESDYKVMVVWLPEKMNSVAANKLLKVLEEPWEKTIFLLISNDSQHLLTTITSRTQITSFSGIQAEDIAKGLIDKMGVDIETANEIATIADGSFAYAIQLLNQSEDDLKNFELFTNWMRLNYQKKIIEVNKWVDEVAALGRERQKSFLMYGLRLIRESFILNLKQSKLSKLAKNEAAFCEKFSPFIHSKNVTSIAEELNSAYYHIERNAYAKLLFLDLSLKIMQLLKA